MTSHQEVSFLPTIASVLIDGFLTGLFVFFLEYQLDLFLLQVTENLSQADLTGKKKGVD